MSNPTLTLERRDQIDKTGEVSDSEGSARILFTPPIGEDYWEYRVALTESQAVIGFPKFSTIGIGFAVEEDWNTNLPYRCDAYEILDHIWHNRGDSIEDTIQWKSRVHDAIDMIQTAAHADRGTDPVADHIAVPR